MRSYPCQWRNDEGDCVMTSLARGYVDGKFAVEVAVVENDTRQFVALSAEDAHELSAELQRLAYLAEERNQQT